MGDKKILMVVAPEKFRDEEFLEPKKVFEQNEIVVHVASKEVKEAKGMFGTSAEVDIDIADVKTEDYDAVVFVGGQGSSIYFENQTALKIARETYEKGKVVGAICIAPGILANSGILKGKKATIFDSGDGQFPEMLKKNESECTGNDVEQDGNVITANGPQAAEKFGKKIVESLK